MPTQSPTLRTQGIRARTLVLCTIVGVLGCSRDGAVDPDDRVNGWRGDIEALRTAVLRVHPPAPSDPDFRGFEAAISALSAEVPALPDEAVVAGIQRALVALGDAHTSIVPDDVGSVRFNALMVDFYWFDDGVHIASVRPGLGGLLGARVTSIGGLAIDEFLTRMAPLVPRDNEMSARWFGAQLMQYPAVVRAAGGSATDSATTLGLVLASGTTSTVRVGSHARAAMQRLYPPGGEGVATPWYLRRRETAFWLDSLPADSVLYVSFQAVRDEAHETLAAFAARVRGLLLSGRFTSVLVEVRGNNGGNGFLLPPLIEAFEAFEDAASAHRIVVITGRGTFSAGQNFATRIEQRTHATFVGEPTGSRPNHIGDVSETQLPYSRLKVAVASVWHRDADIGDTRDWIAPDIVVPVLASDYFANRDPAFEAALAWIRSARAAARGAHTGLTPAKR